MHNFKVDLVFNAFNEIESIEKDLNLIFSLSSENKLIDKIFVIEDGSTDGTSEKLRELSEVNNLNLSQSEQRCTKALVDRCAGLYRHSQRCMA